MTQGNSMESRCDGCNEISSMEWCSADGLFRVVIALPEVEQLLHFCRDAGDQETGGILTGHYSENYDTAQITGVTGPPLDSRASRAFFVRGVRGLQQLLNGLWRRRLGYYIGEWHFHPRGDGMPSATDREQMGEIAVSRDYNCPEPVLIIVARPSAESWAIRTFVYPESRQVELGASAERRVTIPADE